MLSEGELSKAIFEAGLKELKEISEVDVVVVGAGPAGLTASWKLSSGGAKVLLVERSLSIGGGIMGGACLLPVALVEEEAKKILEEAEVRIFKLLEGIYYVRPYEAMIKIAERAIEAGTRILLGYEVEDLIFKFEKVSGVVLNLSPVLRTGMHVDPIFVQSKAVLDATGHEASVLRILYRRLGKQVKGSGFLSVWRGEKEVVDSSGKEFEGLYLAGMSAAEAKGSPRMGPILGGMLLSGEKAAREILNDLGRI